MSRERTQDSTDVRRLRLGELCCRKPHKIPPPPDNNLQSSAAPQRERFQSRTTRLRKPIDESFPLPPLLSGLALFLVWSTRALKSAQGGGGGRGGILYGLRFTILGSSRATTQWPCKVQGSCLRPCVSREEGLRRESRLQPRNNNTIRTSDSMQQPKQQQQQQQRGLSTGLSPLSRRLLLPSHLHLQPSTSGLLRRRTTVARCWRRCFAGTDAVGWVNGVDDDGQNATKICVMGMVIMIA